MYCQKCGKELPDQAKFCSYCGAPVITVQTTTSQQPSQQPAQHPPKAENAGKSKLGKRILSAVIALGVFYLVKTATFNVLTKSNETPAPEQAPGTGIVEIQNTELSDAVSNCINGALYENGSLRYGFAKLSLPGYELHTDEQSSMGDYLLSSDGYSLFNALLQREPMGVSYEATVEEDMLRSVRTAYPDASMIDFQKYQQDGAYVIRSVYRYVDSGTDMYAGELILMHSESCRETVRLYVYQNAVTGHDRIDQIFDTLSISADYAPSSSETTKFGYNQITVK